MGRTKLCINVSQFPDFSGMEWNRLISTIFESNSVLDRHWRQIIPVER